MTTNGVARPDWYPDPASPWLLRYWDGAQWTAHTAPRPGAAPAPTFETGPSEAVHWLLPVGRSAESIAAGYLGLLCLFVAVFAILPFAFVVVLPLAAFTAWLALRALRKASSGGHGRGRAIFGLVGAGLATLPALAGVWVTFTQS